MDDLYLLELSIRHKTGQRYAIDPRLFGPDARPRERPFSGSGSPTMTLDLPGLLSRDTDPLAYGTYLQQLVFADTRVSEALYRAQTVAATAGALLRLRLRLDPTDAALHRVRWELLRDPSDTAFLAMQERTLFSRYFDPRHAPRVERRRTARPQALLAVANPTDLSRFGLAQIDVDSEVARGMQALDQADIIRVAYPATESRATVARVIESLRSRLDIVYLVCHGMTHDETGETVLFLEADDGRCDRISSRALAEALDGVVHWPTLTILVACQTAGSDAGDHPLLALGPRLIEAGCPALLVMNGNLSVTAAEQFFPTFFRQLTEHGHLERALATARATCQGLHDWWRPVLYTRLDDGLIWQPAPAPRLHAGVPELPPYHITRADEERRLVQLLTQQQTPIINVVGLPGTGKTALVAAVLRRHFADLSVDSVLWGDLGRLTPAEQLWEFLSSLTKPETIAPEHVNLLRILFWKQVQQDERRLLIVLDNVTTPQAAALLFPPDDIGELPEGCRMLLISQDELRSLSRGRLPVLPVGTFDADHIRRLFVEILGQQLAERHATVLALLGQTLGGLPHLLTMAALQLRSVSSRADDVRDSIASYLQPIGAEDAAYHERLELALRDLTDSQVAVLDLIGVMGEGDWPATLVAAACLRSQIDAAADLDALVARGILLRLSSGRYSTNRLIRTYARTRLFARPAATYQTTLYLFARACLDIAEDCYLRALEGEGIETPQIPIIQRGAVVQRVRHLLLPEIAHVRAALTWAEQYPSWRLIERFARLAWFELLDDVVANTREITGSLLLATLDRPVFWYTGSSVQVHGRSGVSSQPLRFAHPGLSSPFEISDAYAYTRRFQWPALGRDAPHRHPDATTPELSLQLTASRIVDGIINGYTLIESRWTGVEADRLILSGVDLAGARWLNCTMRNSFFQRCNARHSELRTVDMQGAVLDQVLLRGARLTNIDLRGAHLMHVDFRGAQLVNVDFRGARLDHVTFRGATLTSVRFDGAHLHDVAIHQTELQSTTWYGVKQRPEGDQTHVIIGISHQAHERQADAVWPELPAQTSGDAIVAAPDGDYHGRDLRGVTLAGQAIAVPPPDRPSFSEARLDAARLRGVHIPRARMVRASLRAVDLTDAQLPGADLRSVDLQAALAEGCNFHLADLHGASLRAARLRKAVLWRTNLAQTDFSGADLREADLREADLSGAVLAGADLREAMVDAVALARAATLGRAVLMVGDEPQLIQELAGSYTEEEELFDPEAFLRFVVCSGQFVDVGFAGRDLFGAQLTHSSVFRRVRMRGTNLQYARLSGSFTNVCFCESVLEQTALTGVFTQCGFTHARLRGAHLSGTWTRADFQHADFTETDWTGASLVEADLRGARGVTDHQLQRALRLRGTILPDGERFVSAQGLPGDREDARQAGYDPDDPHTMTAFYLQNNADTSTPLHDRKYVLK